MNNDNENKTPKGDIEGIITDEAKDSNIKIANPDLPPTQKTQPMSIRAW